MQIKTKKGCFTMTLHADHPHDIKPEPKTSRHRCLRNDHRWLVQLYYWHQHERSTLHDRSMVKALDGEKNNIEPSSSAKKSPSRFLYSTCQETRLHFWKKIEHHCHVSLIDPPRINSSRKARAAVMPTASSHNRVAIQHLTNGLINDIWSGK